MSSAKSLSMNQYDQAQNENENLSMETHSVISVSNKLSFKQNLLKAYRSHKLMEMNTSMKPS